MALSLINKTQLASNVSDLVSGYGVNFFYPVSNPSGFLTGKIPDTGSFLTTGQSGIFYPTTNPSGYITGVNLSNYTTISQLTGFSGYVIGNYATLTSMASSIAGLNLSSFASNSNLLVTGSALVNNLNTTGSNLAANLNTTGSNLAANLAATGSNLAANLAATGSTLNNSINAFNFIGLKNITTTSYTLLTGDNGNYIYFTNAGAITVTVNPQTTTSWSSGSYIMLEQGGAGQITVSAGAGVTITSSSTLKSRTQYSAIALIRKDINNWNLVGDMA